MDESLFRFTFHTKNTKVLFNKSKNVFDNVAKGMYTHMPSRNTIAPSKQTFKVYNNNKPDSRNRRSAFQKTGSLMKNNVNF
jgi:hypothetical protein